MKITKKLFKETQQRNVQLNKDYYTDLELGSLMGQELIEYGGKDTFTNENMYRVYLRHIDKLDIALDEYGSLTTVAIMNDSRQTKLYVNL